MAGVGLIASIVVFACLVANVVLRTAGRWLVAQRRWSILVFRAVIWSVPQIALATVRALQYVARSTVVTQAIWLARGVGRAPAWALVSGSALAGCALLYFGAITLGLFAVGGSTRTVVAMLDDPPRPLTMALGMGGATVLMYSGIAAFALCAWITFQAARVGARAATRRVGTVAS